MMLTMSKLETIRPTYGTGVWRWKECRLSGADRAPGWSHYHAVSAFRILSVRAESVGTTGASRFNKTSLLVYSHVGRQSDKWVSAYFVT